MGRQKGGAEWEQGLYIVFKEVSLNKTPVEQYSFEVPCPKAKLARSPGR